MGLDISYLVGLGHGPLIELLHSIQISHPLTLLVEDGVYLIYLLTILEDFPIFLCDEGCELFID